MAATPPPKAKYSYESEIAQGKRVLRALGRPELQPMLEAFAGLETDFGNPAFLTGADKNKGSYQGILQFGPARLKEISAQYEALATQIGGIVGTDVDKYLRNPPKSPSGIHPYKGQGVAGALQIIDLANRFEQETGVPLTNYGAMGAYAYHLLGEHGGSKVIKAFSNAPEETVQHLVSPSAFKGNLGNAETPFNRMNDLNPERWTPDNITPAQVMELLNRKAASSYLSLKEKKGTTPDELEEFRTAVWPNKSNREVESYVNKIKAFRAVGNIMRHMTHVAAQSDLLGDSEHPTQLLQSSLPLKQGSIVKSTPGLDGEEVELAYPEPEDSAIKAKEAFLENRKVDYHIPGNGCAEILQVGTRSIPSPYLSNPMTQRLQEALQALKAEGIPSNGKLNYDTAHKALEFFEKISASKITFPQGNGLSAEDYQATAKNTEISIINGDLIKNARHEGVLMPVIFRRVEQKTLALASKETLTQDEWQEMRHGLRALGYLDLKEFPANRDKPVVQAAIAELREEAAKPKHKISFEPDCQNKKDEITIASIISGFFSSSDNGRGR